VAGEYVFNDVSNKLLYFFVLVFLCVYFVYANCG